MITLLRLLKLGFLGWAAVELVQGHFGYALVLVVVFGVVQVPRLLQLPWAFDAAFIAAWTLQELGQVAGFWSKFSWWDTLVHAALPAALAPTALVLLIRWDVLPDVINGSRIRRQGLAIVMLVFLIAAGFGSIYEIYEWVSDMTRGTHYQPDNTDTMTDITANVVGGVVGGLWLAGWAGRWDRASWIGHRIRGGFAKRLGTASPRPPSPRSALAPPRRSTRR